MPDSRWDEATVDALIDGFGDRGFLNENWRALSGDEQYAVARAVLEASQAVPAEEHERVCVENERMRRRIGSMWKGEREDREANGEVLAAYRERCDRASRELQLLSGAFTRLDIEIVASRLSKIADSLASPVSAREGEQVSGWTCVHCGNYSRTRLGRWCHTYFAWTWRKGTGGRCIRPPWRLSDKVNK